MSAEWKVRSFCFGHIFSPSLSLSFNIISVDSILKFRKRISFHIFISSLFEFYSRLLTLKPSIWAQMEDLCCFTRSEKPRFEHCSIWLLLIIIIIIQMLLWFKINKNARKINLNGSFHSISPRIINAFPFNCWTTDGVGRSKPRPKPNLRNTVRSWMRSLLNDCPVSLGIDCPRDEMWGIACHFSERIKSISKYVSWCLLFSAGNVEFRAASSNIHSNVEMHFAYQIIILLRLTSQWTRRNLNISFSFRKIPQHFASVGLIYDEAVNIFIVSLPVLGIAHHQTHPHRWGQMMHK